MPRKPFPKKPVKPFRLSSLASHIDIVARHTRAGFEHVPDHYVRWHYVFFMVYLAEKHYLVPPTKSVDDALAKIDLWSTDLTDDGYRFVQYAEDRWLGRLRKNDDAVAGRKYLDKWHRAFEQLPYEAFERAG
jgi:hypothetical protein